ncbi:hypothetical protein [Nocardiopsis rhodophaea]
MRAHIENAPRILQSGGKGVAQPPQNVALGRVRGAADRGLV